MRRITLARSSPAARGVAPLVYVDFHDALPRLERVADALEVLVWRHQPVGRAIYLNAAYERLKGVPRALAYGHGWLDLLHPDDRPRVWELLRFAQTRCLPVALTFRSRATTEADYCWIRAYGVPVLSRDRRTLTYLGAATRLGSTTPPADLPGIVRHLLYAPGWRRLA